MRLVLAFLILSAGSAIAHPTSPPRPADLVVVVPLPPTKPADLR